MNATTMNQVIVAMVLMAVGCSHAAGPADYRGRYEPTAIVMSYVFDSGDSTGALDGGLMVTCPMEIVLSGDGALRTDVCGEALFRGTVLADSAIALADDLLALDFFGQPSSYRSVSGWAELHEDGSVLIGHGDAVPGPFYSIKLQVGETEHTVRFNGRARGAAPEFSAWAKRLRSLASVCREEQGH